MLNDLIDAKSFTIIIMANYMLRPHKSKKLKEYRHQMFNSKRQDE